MTDMYKRLLDDATEEIICSTGTIAVVRSLVDGVLLGHRTVEAAVRDIGACLERHDKKTEAIHRARLARAVAESHAVVARIMSESTWRCGVCKAAIWWNPNEPTGQAAGWRHVDQVAAVEYATANGGTHRATPRIPDDAEPQHEFTRTDAEGWCTAVLATGAQCFTGWEDPIHAKPAEAAR